MRPNHARVVGDPDDDPVAADERSDMSCEGIANAGAGIPRVVEGATRARLRRA